MGMMKKKWTILKVCNLGTLLLNTTSLEAIAAPDNFNPALQVKKSLDFSASSTPATATSPAVTPATSATTPQAEATASPPKKEDPPKKPQESTATEEASPPPKVATNNSNSQKSQKSPLVFENVSTDSNRKDNNQGQVNQYVRQTANFSLRDGNKLAVTAGYETYEQPEIDTVRNIPVKLSWEGKFNKLNASLGVGVDFFDRLESGFNFNAGLSSEVSKGLTLSALVEYSPYKFNAETLENKITAWRLGPNIFWQIGKDLSLFSSFRWGSYSDGNNESQLFARLEKKIGQFSVAANLFSWNYSEDLSSKSGYFAPGDFLVYSGELAWSGQLIEDFLKCRLAATLGEQRFAGEFSRAQSYEALCTIKFSPKLETDVGYTYSTLRSQSGTSDPTETFTGKVRLSF